MQYGEDDLTFISRLLSEVGIWFRFATDARLKIEVTHRRRASYSACRRSWMHWMSVRGDI